MFGTNNLLLYLVVLLSNIIQCITGFAGTVLAMPFSLMLVGYDVAKPVLNVLGIVASVGVIASSPKSVNKHEFTKILSVMLVGVLAGEIATAYASISAGALYQLLGAMVLVFTLMGCLDEFVLKKPNHMLFKTAHRDVYDGMTAISSYIMLALAGVVHGLFVCGGPLLVLYADKTLKDKQEFRTTLSAVWLVLNGLIFMSDWMSGYFVPATVNTLGACLAVLLFAVLIGNLIAKKLNRKAFMIATYILMAASGVSLLVK